VIIGKENVVELLMTALLSGGHVLLEDLPGTGKTTLAKALPAVLIAPSRVFSLRPTSCRHTLPASISRPKGKGVPFRPGPIMANIVLADEINRAIPLTRRACGVHGRRPGYSRWVDPTPAQPFAHATQNPTSWRGPFPCRKRSSTVFSCASPLATREQGKRSACWRLRRGQPPGRH
jgi:MoxR-like ATPase